MVQIWLTLFGLSVYFVPDMKNLSSILTFFINLPRALRMHTSASHGRDRSLVPTVEANSGPGMSLSEQQHKRKFLDNRNLITQFENDDFLKQKN